jgi:hypothetical protein
MANPILNEKALNDAARCRLGSTRGCAPFHAARSDDRRSGQRLADQSRHDDGQRHRHCHRRAPGAAARHGDDRLEHGWFQPGDRRQDPGAGHRGHARRLRLCAIFLHFKPTLAKFVAPIYALAEGLFLGVISRFYDEQYNGIVVQAVGATLAVFAVMLFLYRTRIIKVTDRFRRNVIMASMGLMLFYGISIIMRLFGVSVPFINDASPLGIAFSVVAAGLATMMLAVDFDQIERGAKAGWPKGMEWYCAFGLLATLIWLYLEILRLLAKLNRR